jgi:hypothetical protein
VSRDFDRQTNAVAVELLNQCLHRRVIESEPVGVPLSRRAERLPHPCARSRLGDRLAW